MQNEKIKQQTKKLIETIELFAVANADQWEAIIQEIEELVSVTKNETAKCVLIENAGGEINAQKFDSYFEARDAMTQCFDEAGKAEEEYFGTFNAHKIYANNNTNYDWLIIEF